MTIDKAKRAMRRGNGILLPSPRYKEPCLYAANILNTRKGPVIVGWVQLKQRFPHRGLLATALKDAAIVSRRDL